jgi:hypothetical protein
MQQLVGGLLWCRVIPFAPLPAPTHAPGSHREHRLYHHKSGHKQAHHPWHDVQLQVVARSGCAYTDSPFLNPSSLLTFDLTFHMLMHLGAFCMFSVTTAGL